MEAETTFQTYNPATGEKITAFKFQTYAELEEAVKAAQQDFSVWKKSSLEDRSRALKKLAQNLRERKAEISASITREMGKLPKEADGEIDKCILTCEYYAENGPQQLAPEPVKTESARSYISFQPLGVILSIMPWNFPLWQVIRFAAPAVMAGNAILLKHAEITTGTAQLIEKCFLDIAPSLKLLRVIIADHATCAKLIAHPLVRGVTFTGSGCGGKEVAKAAGENLKKSVLELGGSDPYIVLADADIDKAAKACAAARLVNCGQSCVAGKRFIVVKEVAEAFTKAFVEAMRAAQISSLASKKFQNQLVEQVEKMKAAGGEVLLGGTLPQGPGAFYPATVIRFEKNPDLLRTEEIFGPVASLIVAQDEKDAFAIANSTVYGLGGGLFTADLERGLKLVERDLDSGFVVVNDYVKSDPRLPFGGVKDSGYGRELSRVGLHEFVNTKTVVGVPS